MKSYLVYLLLHGKARSKELADERYLGRKTSPCGGHSRNGGANINLSTFMKGLIAGNTISTRISRENLW